MLPSFLHNGVQICCKTSLVGALQNIKSIASQKPYKYKGERKPLSSKWHLNQMRKQDIEKKKIFSNSVEISSFQEGSCSGISKKKITDLNRKLTGHLLALCLGQWEFYFQCCGKPGDTDKSSRCHLSLLVSWPVFFVPPDHTVDNVHRHVHIMISNIYMYLFSRHL